MTFSIPRPTLGRARLIAVALGLVAAPLAWLGLPAADSGAQTPEAPATVSVTPSTGLVDGQRVKLTISPGAAGARVTAGLARLCRDGETYAYAGESMGLIADLQPQNGKCLPVELALSTLASQADAFTAYAFPDGTARAEFSVGAGAQPWTTGSGGASSLECSSTSPCRLVVAYTVSAGGSSTIGLDASTLLTFADEDAAALGGCAGIAPGAPRSVGTARIADLWVSWTRERCAAAGEGALADTSATLTDERSGLEAFAAGEADLVYGSTGYPFGPDAGGQPPGRLADPPVKRPYVATPVALNAVVLAVAGGYHTMTPDAWPTDLPQPFSDLRLTIDEAAALFGQGTLAIDWGPAMARNPELAEVGFDRCCGMAGLVPQVPGGFDSRSLFSTTFFDTLAAGAWHDFIPFGGADRGVVANFSDATPPLQAAIASPYSSRDLLGKVAFGIANRPPSERFGALWTLTDYASAQALGLTPVAIQFEEGGPFVRPTPETIAAGADALVPQPDGTLSPDPAQLAPGAYPLTMVEYALAPAEPLPAERCAAGPLTASWLDYVTGETGQGLVAGQHLVPLTAGLAAQADAAVAQVANAVGASCAPPGSAPGGVPAAAPAVPG
ncbi:MAG TPA: hypothetical protein VFI47_28725, partial [Acidimicrobiales bacterium]|nr:hypothetical protein [Acidimicrobiales bacterium]